MSTTVRVYKSTDTGAPTLSGTVNDLVNLLDKCLVQGYGTQAGAGWVKAFTGTNRAVFRQGGGNQFYLDVDDSASGTGVAREALARGYEVMTAVGVGTMEFPTVAQLAGAVVIWKSVAASAVTRTWVVVADDRTVYLFVRPDSGNPTLWVGFAFGDIYSVQTGDAYRTMIIGRVSQNNTSFVATENLYRHVAALSTGTVQNTIAGHYLARSYHGLGVAQAFGKAGDAGKSTTTFGVSGGFVSYPNGPDGGLLLSPIFVFDGAGQFNMNYRGELRGLWHFLHPGSAVANLDTFSGVGALAGKTFLVLKDFVQTNGIALIETSSSWRTN